MNRLWAPWRMEYLMSGSSEGCIFCIKPPQEDDEANLILLRTSHSFVMLNAYPYNNGHLMVAPYRHVSSFSELTTDERSDLMDAIAHAERILGRAFSPQGMNVGVNLGHCAGAGMPGHIHVHIVPKPRDLPDELKATRIFACLKVSAKEALPPQDVKAFCKLLRERW